MIIYFNRVPKDADSRIKWINSIKTHQEFDYYSVYHLICERHFKSDDFEVVKGKRALKKGSVPIEFVDKCLEDSSNGHEGIEQSVGIQQYCDEDGARFPTMTGELAVENNQYENHESNKDIKNRPRYCKIRNCIHETGTRDREITFFRYDHFSYFNVKC